MNFTDPTGTSILDSFRDNDVVEAFRGVFSAASLFGATVFAGTQAGSAYLQKLTGKVPTGVGAIVSKASFYATAAGTAVDVGLSSLYVTSPSMAI